MIHNVFNAYYILALTNAILWSLSLTFYRFVMTKGADPKTLMIVGQLGSCLFLILLLGVPNYRSYEWSILGLLITSGLLWSLGVFLEIAALKFIEATASGIIGAARYVFAFTVGIVALGEALTPLRAFGVVMIVTAIIGISEFKQISFRRGFWLTLVAVIFQVLAYAIDKKLAEQVPAATIVISSFFFPGCTFLLLYPKKLNKISKEFHRSHGLLLLLPIGLALCNLAIIKAFAIAEFVTVLAIAESAFIFTCLFAFLLLGERERPIRKIICSLLCAVGVVLVCRNG